MYCEECGAGNYESSRFCHNCGRPLTVTGGTAEERVVEAGTLFCGECGVKNPEKNRFCSACGKPVGKPQDREPQENGVKEAATGSAGPGTAQDLPEPPAPAPQPRWKQAVLYSSIAAGLISFFFQPYLLSVVAIILGAATMAGRNRLGILGIAIGIAAILADYSYLNFLTYIAG